jgi:hypothetical protein
MSGNLKDLDLTVRIIFMRLLIYALLNGQVSQDIGRRIV